MLSQHTIATLRIMKLTGMALAFEEQLTQSAVQPLNFEERFSLLVDREITYRNQHKQQRLLKKAKLKQATACLENINYQQDRHLNKQLIANLTNCDWIQNHHNLLITGATGCGKTWIACAFAQQACRQGFTVVYTRLSRLLEELKIARGNGTFTNKLNQLAKTELLLIDDFGLTPINQAERSDLLEVLDDRIHHQSTIVTSQLPVDQWHTYLNDPTLADAILDRIIHNSHRLELKGDSMRKK